MKFLCKSLFVSFFLIASALICACGGTGSGGAGADSSGASLALDVDNTTVAAGSDTVTATVTLTSLNDLTALNGVGVNVSMTYNGVSIGSASANTNSNGIAVVSIPVGLVSSDRTVSLQATSSGVTPSASVSVAVKAPLLVATLTDVTNSVAAAASLEMIFSGANVSFKDYSGNGFNLVPITFTLDSVSGSSTSLIHNGTVVPVGGSFSVTTDSSGAALLGLSAVLTAPNTAGLTSSATYNYTLSVTYLGYTYTKQGSVNYTLTAS